MGDTQTITRKIQIFPVGNEEEINRVYKYIRDGMYKYQMNIKKQVISCLEVESMGLLNKGATIMAHFKRQLVLGCTAAKKVREVLKND